MAGSGFDSSATPEPSQEGGPVPSRLMIVEDDDDIRSGLTELLQERGFDVGTATNGREALDVLRTTALPSVILLDLMMPVMDGWDFRRKQMTDPILREIPVVILTAEQVDHDTVRAELGDVVVISKPISFAALFGTIDRASRTAKACQ